MKPAFLSRFAIAVLCLLFAALPAFSQGTAFLYQGRLNDNGSAATGSFDLQFTLFATPNGGGPVAGPVTSAPTSVSNGLFAATLDFGGGVFNGADRWMEIAVRPFGSPGAYQTLSPRQRLAPTPYAMRAQTVASVADSALSGNVVLLTSSPVFTMPVSAPTLRVSDATGGGRLSFGNNPDNLCSISVDPAGPEGLLLGDPRGIRILSPLAQFPPILRFGPTDDCSLGIDPAFPGLVERDPIGFRLLGRNNEGCRLIFGPTFDCTVEVRPPGTPGAISGLLLRDPNGIRILSPNAAQPPRLIFGPTDDCSLGIDPALPGLRVLDPSGLRIAPLAANAQPRLIFGPTDDCSLGIDPAGPQGLLLRDPRGIRILSPNAAQSPRLLFGPTDDCSLGIDPAFPGLVERDPIGFRLLGQNNQGCRLIFGPTMDCTVEVSPPGPTAISGLLLRDPRGIRILPPAAALGSPPNAPVLIFGPTDDCSISIDPTGGMPGILLRDPSGVRLIDALASRPRLFFGPTNLCSIGITGGGGAGPARMTFSDPQPFLFTNSATVVGTVTAQAFIQASTRRLKDNIKPLENSLELIQQLQGVRYDWIPERGGKADIGFIAEEVGKIFPELVEWEADGINAVGVNYTHLVAVAVEGIKAQQSQIKTLEREKAELKQTVEAMQEKLEKLSQKIDAFPPR